MVGMYSSYKFVCTLNESAKHNYPHFLCHTVLNEHMNSCLSPLDESEHVMPVPRTANMGEAIGDDFSKIENDFRTPSTEEWTLVNFPQAKRPER